MRLQTLLLILTLPVCETLIRQDYLHCRVPKWGLRLLLLFALLLRTLALLEQGFAYQVVAHGLFASLARGLLFILPLLLLYAFKRAPGPADIKYAFFVSFLLEPRQSYALIIGGCIWALCSEQFGKEPAAASRTGFAFLPYLILATLPFIYIEYWAWGE